MTLKHLVFIDSRVAGQETLIAQLGIDTEWHLLDAGQDGVEQMQRLLAGRTGLDSIQVVSHGAAGTLYLGSTVLNAGNLGHYQIPLQAIGSSLTETGDLLLYGCNVAQGQMGASFVDALARITGADVAASDDATGPARLGGDAELERASGAIEAAPLALDGLRQTLTASASPTFAASGGVLTTDFGEDDYGYSIIQQADGKLLVAGCIGSNAYDYDLALARYNADGTLDASFDGDGRVATDFGGYEEGFSVIQQADGKLVVGGYTYTDYDNNSVLTRYNTDGTLDTSFDGDGKLMTDFGSGYDYCHSVIQQADGKLVVAGGRDGDFALARYNANGTLDTSFSGDGKRTTDFGANDAAVSVIQQTDGKLLVAGASGDNFALVRYTVGGGVDVNFGNGGKLTIDFGSYDQRVRDVHRFSMIQQTDGKLVMASTIAGNFALARYNADGTLDASFDGDGKLTTDFGWDDKAYSVIQQADGKLVVAGSTTISDGESDFALVRYNADGTLDTSFGDDGKVRTDVESSDTAYSVIQQADGKLVVAGISGGNFALARYNLDGSLDDSINHAPTGVVAIQGSARQGQTLTIANSLADADGLGTISYQWKANGTAISGATASTFTLGQAQVGKAISVTARYTDQFGTAESVSSAATSAVGNVNDAPTGAVTVRGTATQGQTLTASNNLTDADGLGTISYQWKANGSAISGATASTFTLGQAQVGKAITVTASYTDALRTAESVSSAATSAVANVNDAPTGSVTISGTAVQGQRLQVVSTLQDPDGAGTARVQWLRDGAAISGATAASYTLTDSDVGKLIAARLSYTDGGGFAETRTSTAVTPAGLNPGVTLTGADRTTGENGDTAVFSVKLNKAPVNPVTIQFAVSDATEARLGASSLTFTKANWHVAQTLTVTGVDDFDNDGAIAYNLTASIVTNDLSYKRVTISPIALINQNDALDAPIQRYGTDAAIDYLRGGNGADRLYGRGNMDDLRGGRGDDRLYGDEDDDVLYGEDGNDWLYGGVDDDQLSGGNGNDELYGNDGVDQLEGGAGNDTLDGGTGADTMIGGAGNDIYWVDNANDVVNDQGLATDEDTVLILAAIRYKLATNVENAELRDTSGAASLEGNTLANDLTGNASQNTLDGGAGNDVLDAGAGNDTLLGGAGTDSLVGGLGNDRLDGGAGDDLADYSDAAAGAVNVNLATGNASGDGVDTLVSIEDVIGSAGADTLVGSNADNELSGGAGNDQVSGGLGNDVLDAGAGNDTLTGGTGTDSLVGGAGSDRLDGGVGTDSLYGGAADKVADTFDFNASTESTVGATRDKVYDFVTKIDKIDLAGIDANTATKQTGDQAFTFNTTTAKANAIWYKVADVDGNAATRDIILYGDVNGNTTADFEIGLVGVTSLVGGDFVL